MHGLADVSAELARHRRIRLTGEDRRRPTPAARLSIGAPSRDDAEVAVTASATRALEPAVASAADRSLRGVGIGGWTGAAALYGLVAAAAAVVSWTTLQPAPWPDSPPVFRVVFEAPAEPPAPPPAAPVAETPPAMPATPPPIEAAPPVEAAPPPSLLADAPPPPPHKPHPQPRHMAAAPATVAPAVPPSETQVAAATTAMPPPPLAPPGDSVYVPPHPTSAGDPAYPAEARQHGWQGRVLLRLEIAPDGTVSASVKSSSGHAVLDSAALANARSWRFAPATRGGVAVIGSVERAVDFHLED